MKFQFLCTLSVLILFMQSSYGQEPCQPACCPNGAQHTFEGQTGDLPTFGTLTNGGWESNQGSPSYTADGCDSPLTSIELDGTSFGSPGDQVIFSQSGIGGPVVLFEDGKTYCIQMCIKVIGSVPGSIDLSTEGVSIGSLGPQNASSGWQTLDITWTSTGNFENFLILNNSTGPIDNPPAIRMDDVCISEVVDVGPLCDADFSYEIQDCGEVCFTQELCGEVTFFSWLFSGPGLPIGGLGSLDVDPCFIFPQSGTYTVDLIVNCSDGTQMTETQMIDILIPDPPEIICPEDLVLNSTDSAPCDVEYTFPSIAINNATTITCTIDGLPVNANDVVILSQGVHLVQCTAENECAVTLCEYMITVTCEPPIECTGPCYDFNEPSSSSNWVRYNSGGRFPSRDPVNLATRGPGDTYLDGVDISGSTWLYNNTDYSGDWNDYTDCCFCFDYKYVDDANTPTTARPQLSIYQGPEDAPFLQATYISNFILTDDDPWRKVCTPFSQCVAGQLPSNADGYWIMNVGSGCADWNTLISNVDGIRFPLDYNGNPRERHGYDNTCWEPCPANPCDSFMVMVDTLERQIACVDPSLITGNPCPSVYDPVCGCDGITYGNACEAREAGVGIITPGECDGSNTPDVNGCCYALDIVLKSVRVHAIGIKALNGGVIFNTAMINDPAFTFTLDPSGREIIVNPTGGPTFGPGVFDDLIKFCLSVDSTIAPPTQFIEITYYDQNGEELEAICRKSVELGCDPPPGADPCVLAEAADATCQDGYYDIDITVSNVSTTPPFTAGQVVFTSCDPNILFRPDGTLLPPNGSIGLPLIPPMGSSDPPQTLPVDIVPIVQITTPTQFCFETTIWNNNMCCTSPDKVCVTLDPCCNPCDSSFLTGVMYNPNQSNSTISIKPGPIMNDAYLSSCQIGGFWTNQSNLYAGNAWGGASDGCSSDAYLNFPLDDLCPDAVITHAELKLFSDPLSPGHVNTTSLTSSCLDIKRVTSTWSESTTSLTPPSTTSTNQVSLPLPLTPYQDFSVDITGLVQDILANPSGSFGIVLDASCPLDLQYIFASGEHSDPTKWPELIITYDVDSCPPADTACCHSLDIEVGCADDYFTKLELEVITPGVVIGSHSTGSSVPTDWSNPVTTNQRIIWEHNSGTIPDGTYDHLINFCLDDIDPGESPQELTLKWYARDQNGMDSVACIDTLRYQCEPPINDSCLAILDVIPKNNLCDTCYVEPFCNPWLLDEVIHQATNTCLNPSGSAKIETGTWLGDPVFIITTDLGWPHTFVERVMTCQGIELQNCHDYIGGFECDPDASIDVTTDIIGKSTIWQCGDPIPSAPATCTALSVPNSVDYCLTIKNVSNHTATQLLIQSLNTGVTIWPSPYTFPTSLPPGGITTVDINISGNVNPGDLIKFGIRLHDHLSGDDWCCFESDTVCIQIPECPPEPDCCDVSEETFCQLFDQIATPIIDADECEICWNLNELDSCDVLYWQIDNQPWMSASDGQLCQIWQDNEAHDVCLRIERWSGGHIGVGRPCMVKDTCMTITIPCDPCNDLLDCSDLSVSAAPNSGPLDVCCYDITVENNYCDLYFKGIKLTLQSPASISSVLTYPGWVINQLDNYNAEIYPISGGLMPLVSYTPFSMCNQSSTDYTATISWLVQRPDGSCIEECPTELELESCNNDFSCYEFVQDSVDCITNTYCFKIKNTSNPAFDLYIAHLYNAQGGLIFNPANVNIPGAPLSPGNTSDWICVQYSGVIPGGQGCYNLAASNQPAGTPLSQCCTDTIVHCFDVPMDCCPPDTIANCCLDFNSFTAIDTFGLISPTIANGCGEDYIDFDNDGDYDYLFWRPTTSSSTGDIFYFENAGTPTSPNFITTSPPSLFTDQISPYGIDYDGDGDTDIFTVEISSREVIYHENLAPSPGFGTLRTGTVIVAGSGGHPSIAVGDLSNDGIADLLVHVSVSGDLEIVYYEGNCSTAAVPCFTLAANSYAAPLIKVPGAQVTSFNQIELEDGDCDGDLDIFMADGNFSSTSPDGAIWYLENYGSIVSAGSAPDIERTTFSQDPFGLTGWQPAFEEATIRFVDIDADGNQEAFIHTGLGGEVYFYENCQSTPVMTSCCCRDSTAFCDLVDLGFSITTDGCDVIVDAPQFDTCHWFGTPAPDWGDGSVGIPVLTPAVGAGPWTYTYSSSGTYNICITVYEGEDEDNFCWDKQMCTEVTVDCCGPIDCDQLSIHVDPDPVFADSCCFIGSIENDYCETGLKGVIVRSNPGSSISQITALNGWYINQISATEAEVYPPSNIPLGVLDIFRVCNENFSGPFTLTLAWLVDDGNGGCQEICPIEEELDCGIEPPSGNCLDVISDRTDCEQEHCFTIENKTRPAFDMKSVVIHNVSPAGSMSPTVISLVPDLRYGDTREICVNYNSVVPGQDVCYTITGHDVDLNDTPFPTQCCADTLTHCFTVPACPPDCCDDFDSFCDLVDLGFSISKDGCEVVVDAPQFDSCHWFGTPAPDWGDGSVGFPVITPAPGAGPWTYTYDDSGTYNICITVYEGEDEDNFCWDKQMCTEVSVECQQDTTCCTDFDEFCDLIDLGFDFGVDSSLLSVTLDQFDSCHWFMMDGPDWGDGTPTIPLTTNAAGSHTWSHTYDSTGMYSICIDVYEGDSPDDICWEKQICKMLWIVCNHPDTTDINPCGPSRMIIPNGITPNNDGFNDALVISGPSQCTPIDITVFNRWGQKVWEQQDYDNTWSGLSENGEQLPDGTYFLRVDFHRVENQRISYLQNVSYLDIRSN